MKKSLILAGAAIALSIVGAGIGAAKPVSAITRLGGVSMYAACNDQHPGTTLVLVENTVSGWKCRTSWSGGVVDYGIDVEKRCKRQYGRNAAKAAYDDYNDPYSWYCYV